MTRAEKVELLKKQAADATADLCIAALAFAADPCTETQAVLEFDAERHAAAKNLLQAVLDGKRV